MVYLFTRRARIREKQKGNPERTKNLLDLADASDAFRRANDELKIAQQKAFNEDGNLRDVSPTLIPSALKQRARERVRTIAERMMR